MFEDAPKERKIGSYFKKSFVASTNNSLVYSGMQEKTRKNVILKFIPLKGKVAQIDQECSIQNSIKYKYIMPLQEIFVFNNKYRVLVMEFAKGSLVSSYAEHFYTSSLQVYKIMYQITKGISFLHDNFILHGDIKPYNIVLMESPEYMPFPLIIDFGHAQILKRSSNYSCKCNRLTPDFSAPELLRLQPHSFPSDIFSLGATFYFMITENLILNESGSYENRALSIENNVNLLYKNRFGPEFPQSGKNLILSMLNKDPALRPTAKQVLESDFFKETILNDTEWVEKEIEFENTVVSQFLEEELDFDEIDF